MFSKLVDTLFGCLHTNYSFPRTTKPICNSGDAPSTPHTYVVCLDCGKHLAYDWHKMKIVSRIKQIRVR
jgi:hypothetical protein